MTHSRRDLALLLPALAAASTTAQAAGAPVLPAATFQFDDLPVRKTGPDGQNRHRAVFDGLTHSGFPVELHETELAPGLGPHPAHHHEHEEIMLVREGTLEVTIDGKAVNLGPGGVAYIASNREHGLRNVGATRAQYFVMALGRAPKS